MYKGLIHFHSQYSYDSILKIKDIVKFALKNELNFLVLTDHDTITGAQELQKYVKDKGIDLEIIVAAEYKTEYGDVIALGIENEITEMNFDEFVKEVKNQKGLILFPHPYYGHKEIEIIAKECDLIEVFNSRIKDEYNHQAILLANHFNKPKYYATDAHNYRSLKNSIISFEKKETFIKSLLQSSIKQSSKQKTFKYEVLFSQFVKGYKIKDSRLLMSVIRRIVLGIITLRIIKKT